MVAEHSIHQIPTVPAERVLALAGDGDRPAPLVIDLRTPKEFAQDHIPGARNLPIFHNEERALVGTLFKQESPQRAFQVGRELVSERIEALFEGIAEAVEWDLPGIDLPRRVLAMTEAGIEGLETGLEELLVDEPPERAVFFHCWRGGLRSRSVVALLRSCGFERAHCIQGGYHAYRGLVVAELERWRAPATYVIRGYTGVGKTLVLRELDRLRPGWALDLEAFAGHRSSILGMVGLEPVSQKRFESRLAACLRGQARSWPAGPVVVEGESRRIGDRIQPASVWAALQGGRNIRLWANLERRIDVLLEDYLSEPDNRQGLRQQLPFIEKRLGPVQWKGRLVGLLDAEQDRELVRTLLLEYYDPLYEHSEKEKHYAVEVEMRTPDQAAAEIVAFVEADLAGAGD